MNIDDDGCVVKGTTCFAEHERYEVCCDENDCRKWFDSKQHFNCVLIAAQKGPMTQNEIGDFFYFTRMRVCQLEKKILQIVNENSELTEEGWSEFNSFGDPKLMIGRH